MAFVVPFSPKQQHVGTSHTSKALVQRTLTDRRPSRTSKGIVEVMTEEVTSVFV